MTKRWPETEAQLAEPVVEWFEERGWDVYQEVGYRGPIADIVATLNGRVWVVECKRSLGMAVIGQADFWKRHAHWTSVAIPKKKNAFDGVDPIAQSICRDRGIGCFVVHQNETVKEILRPRMMRFVDRRIFENRAFKEHDDLPSNLLAALRPEHKTYAKAGSAEGGHYTPFRYTCNELTRLVKNNPGICLKDAIDGLNHHYSTDSTARASMSMWVDAGKVPGVKKVRDGKFVRFYPVEV